MTETSTATPKRKAEGSMNAEAPKAKTTLRECPDERQSRKHAIALEMDNYDLIQLGISDDGGGQYSIAPTIVAGILKIIRARPKHWHLEWQKVENKIQKLLDSGPEGTEYVDVKETYSLLRNAQEKTENDRSLVKGICGAALEKSQVVAWKTMRSQMTRLGRALHHLLGLPWDQSGKDADCRILATTVVELADTDEFKLDSVSYGHINPDLCDSHFGQNDSAFRALRSQMMRAVLYYEDRQDYLSLLDEIVEALADGHQSEDKVVEETTADKEESGSRSDSDSGESTT